MLDIVVIGDSERIIMIEHNFMMFIANSNTIKIFFEGGGTGPLGPPLDPPLCHMTVLKQPEVKS